MSKGKGGRPPKRHKPTVQISHRVLPETKEWIDKEGGSDFLDFLHLAVQQDYLSGKDLRATVRKARKEYQQTLNEPSAE